MNYKVIPTPEFVRNLKTLKKKYKNIKNDVLELADRLEKNPTFSRAISPETVKELRNFEAGTSVPYNKVPLNGAIRTGLKSLLL